MRVVDNVLELIGGTPMVRVSKLDTGPCELYLKLELANPGGSIKDRIGLSMIERAEERGELKPGDTIVEATAGNTGLGLALVAGRKGYPLVIVIPDKMSPDKILPHPGHGRRRAPDALGRAEGSSRVLPGPTRKRHRRGDSRTRFLLTSFRQPENNP